MSREACLGTSPRRPRPGLGFMLDDEEMLGRLGHLYGPDRAEAIGKPCEEEKS